MRTTTFFPSIVWIFSLVVSSFLVLIYKSILGIYLINMSVGFSEGILFAICHFLIGCTIGLFFYFFFAKIGNSLIDKGNTDFERKIFINTYGILICLILWFFNFIFFLNTSPFNFFAIPFFISMTFAIWHFKIKVKIIEEETVEDILDDNFFIPRK